MRSTFGPEGEIRGTDLLAALVALWRESASGSLQFSRSGAMAGFELAGGEVVSASSSDSRFETGAILVRAGKLDASALERMSTQEGGDRARTALQAGLLTKREWRWGEKIRAVEVLSDLLTWLEGDYTYFRTTLREPGEFRLTIPRLILELFLRSRDRGLVLHYLGGADVPLVRSANFDAEFATFGLTSDAEAVVRLIDGKSTAAEIASEAPADAFAVEKLLAALVTLGLIHPEYAGEAPESRPRLPVTPPGSERTETPREDTPSVEPEEAAAAPPAELEAEEPPAEAAPEAEAEAAAGADEPVAEPVSSPEPEPSQPEERSEPEELELESLEPEIDLSEQEPRSDYESEIAGGSGGHDAQEDLGTGPSELYEASPFDRPLDTTTGVGGPERPRPRPVSPVIWLLVLLGAALGAILLFRSKAAHPPATAAVHTPVSTAHTPAAATGPDGVLIATGVPTAAATALPTRVSAATAMPTAIPTRRAPTAAPPSPRPTTARAPASAAPSEAAAATTTRQPWLDRAARDQKRLAGEPKTRYAIQLELACETQSLADAWKHDRPTGTMWLLTTDYQGRTCFRVLWGRYPSPEAAKRAQGRTPAFFSTAHNRPAVVAVP